MSVLRSAALVAALLLVLPFTAANAAKVGEACGTIAGIECDKGLWCDPEPNQCGVADAAGVCITVPEFCTADYNPVCGCDGKTYGNNCNRQASKVALARDGACEAGDAKK